MFLKINIKKKLLKTYALLNIMTCIFEIILFINFH